VDHPSPSEPGRVVTIGYTRCANRRRTGCRSEVRGIDPYRTCVACRANGSPVSVTHFELTGEEPLPPMVLGNAHLLLT
jgi:hypothetical protein